MINEENLHQNWKLIQIKDCCELVMGQSPPGSSYNEEGNGIPFLQGKAEFGKIFPNHIKFTTDPKRNAKKGSILMSVRAPVGDVNISNIDYCIGRGLASLNLKNGDNKYLFYLLNYLKPKIEESGTGSTFKAITKSGLEKIKIPVPPLEAQKKIVEILEKAEKLKEWRAEADELADEYLKSLFNQMFLNQDFDTDYLKNYTQLISSGSTPKGGSDNYLDEGEILFIRSQNVRMNKFSDHDSLYIPLEIHNKMKRTWVKNKDILLNITGASIGRTTIYEGKSDKANVNQHVCIIRLKDFKTLNPTYLSYFLASSVIQKHILQKNAGATRQALNFTQIGKFKIPIPPIELQNKFAKTVEIIENLKTHQSQSKQEIDNLFNTLMQKAFKGELVC